MRTHKSSMIMMLGLACSILASHSIFAQHYPAGVFSDFKWRLIGPFRGGRTRAVAGVPSQHVVFYVGAVDGGLWKTNDAGRTWHPIFDGEPTQSIGAIAVAPSDPNIIYVGSGEGLLRPDLSVGDGIYRSTDAGRTWTHLGLADAQQIADLAVDPHDSNRVFAAVLGHPYGPSPERGIYRSVDGGAHWERVLFKDQDTGGSAVVIDPSHPNVIYAALWQARLGPWEDNNEFRGNGGGLFKSTDGGTTWKPLTAGLPKETTQINIAIAPSMPNRVYAIVGTTEASDYTSAKGLGVFRSDDGGESWSRITQDPRPALRIGGGDLARIAVDPMNADVVYTTSIVTMKSSDGGKTWMSLKGAPGGDDYQNIWINPNDPEIIALVSDQGAVISLDGGHTWSSWFNQPTAQLYHVSVTPTFPYRVCSGQQESGSVCIETRGNDGEITNRDWHPVGAIEYASVAPDPLDPDVIYGAGRTEVSKFHWSTGQVQNVTPVPVKGDDVRADRTEPLEFSPLDPHTLYYGANRLYKTSDGGATWQTVSPDLTRADPGIPASVGALHLKAAEHQRGALYALGISPLDAKVLWVGTDDGLVWRTTDGGANWSNVTPPGVTAWSKVTQIEVSHFDAGTAYVAVSRMRIDDLRPYLFRTHDGGKSWRSISGGLPPDAPVNAVREDPQRQGLLFAATEKAVWVSPDEGAHWDSLQFNLPHTSMRDLAVHGNDLIVATHGRSFWILDDISRLRQIRPGLSFLNQTALLDPAPAYRVRRSTWTDTPIPPDEPHGQNPPPGAVIEYFLPRNARGPVTLEILDGSGGLVRRFRSDDRLEPTPEELARELIPQYWIKLPRALPTGRGMHRWVWDLHYAAPFTITRGYPISAVPHATPQEPQGPLVLPGSYRAQLIVEGRTYVAPLTVLLDPRERLPNGALEDQLRLARKLADLLSGSSRALLMGRSEQAQLKALAAATAATGAAIKSYEGRLSALLDSAKPHLSEVQGNLGTLYGEVTQADAAPTAAQVSAAQAAETASIALMLTWQQLQDELPALNARLRAQKLAEVRPGVAPPRDLNEADED
jgi:photosystem II stability/assembly factor-like uncharacterized protein